ncbi:hypothetical protein CEUSTIGMA_g12104.t1 [Chlamydomonas eustigma]|uniref:Solanesyl diphosphate synthase n=1 Tax=Chlamydomonas eustigma TaxID=1157962 RepID=A0A250XNW0_9CHLO|nr:hypothetical protein CEUSTIGMA_g12104.t1 [Chlamydomonas eustigma]|eukprot:GAX84683.1 hypothetical protein CEUSTIGMA_g12104.t1 [Chlamydomonas eustigma]
MSRPFTSTERFVGEPCSTSLSGHTHGVVSRRVYLSSCRQKRRVLPRVMVMTPARVEHMAVEPAILTDKLISPTPVTITPEQLLQEVLAPVATDMEEMRLNLKNVVGQRHPMLMAAAEQIFSAGGKRLRPAIVFLVAYATCQLAGNKSITDRHRRLAEIMEMIHTASLVHDDILDECDIRRGKATINSLYGTRVAVLAGDFLFAQSSWFLANLENIEVIKLISQVIADFANGEISQATSLFNTDITLQQYLDKSFYKTASLIAASCRSAAALSDSPEHVKAAMYEYGKHLGLAFQVVDDILDFTQSTEQLGKPQGQDLASGNLTAPAIFALASSEHSELSATLLSLIDSEFLEEGSLQQALKLVESTGGLSSAKALARQEADLALSALDVLPDGASKRSLVLMVDYVLDRIY